MSLPQGGDDSVVPHTKQVENKESLSYPISIGVIKPQQASLLGDNPEKFTLLVKSRGGETLRELKWTSDRGGWPVDIVQLRRTDTEILSIVLRKQRLSSVFQQTIASVTFDVKDAEGAIRGSQDHLEMAIAIPSQNGSSGDKLILIAEISASSLLPVWIALITLTEPADGVTDQTLENLELAFRSKQGKTLQESPWDSSHRHWEVNLPLLRGSSTAGLSIELRKKRRIGTNKTLATLTLNIEEMEQAQKESKTEIRKIFTISPNSGLNVKQLVVDIHIGGPDMPISAIERVALPRAAAKILENTSVLTRVLDELAKILQHKRELDEKLANLVDSMNQVYGCAIVKDDPLRNYDIFQSLFDAMLKQSIECFLFISNYISDGYLRHMVDASQKIDEFTKAFRKLKALFSDVQQYKTTTTILETKDLLVDLRASFQHFEQKFDLRNLQAVLEKELGTNEFHLPSEQPRCLLGTRRRTLSEILSWISTGEESLLWLSGIAGSGKSSVMATLHDYLAQIGRSGRLAAYVRFHRSTFASPSKFVKALAYRLASFDRRLGAEIATVLDDQPVILQQPLANQLLSLVTQPLDKYKATMKAQGQIIVLIDGLDECMEEPGGSGAFNELLTLFSQLASRKTFKRFPFLRFIVASRPEEPIHTAFTKSTKPDNDPDHPTIRHLRLDTSSPETTADILHYLTVKFAEIFQKNDEFKDMCEQQNAVQRLAESSHGLFIWAAVVFRFLRDFPRPGRLRSALDMTLHQNTSAVGTLNELYSTLLESVAGDGDEDIKSHIRTILGFVVAFEKVKSTGLISPEVALTETILRGLLIHLTDEVDDILFLLPKLGAFIEGAYSVDSPDAELDLLHKSFEDYLTNERRAGVWYVDVKGHWSPKLAECCVRVVHASVFSEAPEALNSSIFAYNCWTVAFQTQLDIHHPFPEYDLSRMFLEILQQGMLRWVYRVETGFHRLLQNTCSHTFIGIFMASKTVEQSPEIVIEMAEVFLPKWPLGEDLLFNLQAIFLTLCLYADRASALRRYYIPQFSDIAFGSRNFFTILERITTNSLDWLKRADALKHENGDNSMGPQISGVPGVDVLEAMISELNSTGRLVLSHYNYQPARDD
ncbi:hypothetical protein V5O48_008360 [Marasmius crinis-equi]|uniref:NACHT domain-containing protein n=1 Tax=Marasmius crinis-equi TaxID=585013 RepID=A0ABR3FE66_9AGAR